MAGFIRDTSQVPKGRQNPAKALGGILSALAPVPGIGFLADALGVDDPKYNFGQPGTKDPHTGAIFGKDGISYDPHTGAIVGYKDKTTFGKQMMNGPLSAPTAAQSGVSTSLDRQTVGISKGWSPVAEDQVVTDQGVGTVLPSGNVSHGPGKGYTIAGDSGIVGSTIDDLVKDAQSAVQSKGVSAFSPASSVEQHAMEGGAPAVSNYNGPSNDGGGDSGLDASASVSSEGGSDVGWTNQGGHAGTGRQGEGMKDLNDPSNVDTVPAMLTKGEYVVNKEASQKYGPLLEQINNEGLSMRDAENQQVQGGQEVQHRNMGGPLMLNDGGSTEGFLGGLWDVLKWERSVAPPWVQQDDVHVFGGVFGFGSSRATFNKDTGKWMDENGQPYTGYIQDQINQEQQEKYQKTITAVKSGLEDGSMTPEQAVASLTQAGINESFANDAITETQEAIETAKVGGTPITDLKNLRTKNIGNDVINNLLDTGKKLGWGQSKSKLLYDPTTGQYYRQTTSGNVRRIEDAALTIPGQTGRVIASHKADLKKGSEGTAESDASFKEIVGSSKLPDNVELQAEHDRQQGEMLSVWNQMTADGKSDAEKRIALHSLYPNLNPLSLSKSGVDDYEVADQKTAQDLTNPTIGINPATQTLPSSVIPVDDFSGQPTDATVPSIGIDPATQTLPSSVIQVDEYGNPAVTSEPISPKIGIDPNTQTLPSSVIPVDSFSGMPQDTDMKVPPIGIDPNTQVLPSSIIPVDDYSSVPSNTLVPQIGINPATQTLPSSVIPVDDYSNVPTNTTVPAIGINPDTQSLPSSVIPVDEFSNATLGEVPQPYDVGNIDFSIKETPYNALVDTQYSDFGPATHSGGYTDAERQGLQVDDYGSYVQGNHLTGNTGTGNELVHKEPIPQPIPRPTDLIPPQPPIRRPEQAPITPYPYVKDSKGGAVVDSKGQPVHAGDTQIMYSPAQGPTTVFDLPIGTPMYNKSTNTFWYYDGGKGTKVTQGRT